MTSVRLSPSRRVEVVVPPELLALLEGASERQRHGDLAGADELCAEALRRDPRCAAAWFYRSDVAAGTGEHARTAEYLERAVSVAPENPVYSCNLAAAYRRLHRLDDAVRVLHDAIAFDAGFPETHRALGILLEEQRRPTEACSAYEAALRLKPDLPGCAHRLVGLLTALRDHQGAIAAFKRYEPKLSDSVELLCAGGDALREVYRFDEALVRYNKALERAPDSARAHASLGYTLADSGELDEGLRHMRRAAELDPRSPKYRGALVYLLPFHPATDPATVLEEARRYERLHAPEREPMPRHDNVRDPERRLRIGYVSGAFCRHVEAHFTLPLLANHDRSSFDICCYSNVRHPDETSGRLAALVDGWCDISQLSDDAAAERIRADRVDILVDLALHTGTSRLPLFARKPAPVEVCWLAYPGTTGLSAIDYRITDVHLDPPGTHDDDYAERSLRLPETFWCYDPLDDTPVSELPSGPGRPFTFGSLGSFRKVSAEALELWARVLGEVPDSRLRLVAPPGKARARVRRSFEAAGVDPERIDFAAYQPRPVYLAEFRHVDCCLDTVPYNGGTTTLDAFWMGVPVVTLSGRMVTGRSGTSLAKNVGLPELVTTTPEEYVARAAELASDRVRLAGLRGELRARLAASPLMDAPRFARNLEQAFRTAWTTYCRSVG